LMSVKITLGNKLSKTQLFQEELNARLNELTNNLNISNEENKKLMSEIEFLRSENIQLINKISNLSDNVSSLNKVIQYEKISRDLAQEEHSMLFKHHEDLINTNKKLKFEIEKLSNEINSEKMKVKNYSREIEEIYKVKDQFEIKVIELTGLNEKLNENVKIYESVLKQKEKYIEILIRKNSDRNYNNTSDSNKNFSKDKNEMKSIKQNVSVSSSTISNVIILQNKITELEEKLKTKDELIRKIELEKANLITRFRNFSKN
jgi:chromosome segregation ATPase